MNLPTLPYVKHRLFTIKSIYLFIYVASYHYEWTLVNQPESEDGQVGQMQDMNTATLKLSKVSWGGTV